MQFEEGTSLNHKFTLCKKSFFCRKRFAIKLEAIQNSEWNFTSGRVCLTFVTASRLPDGCQIFKRKIPILVNFGRLILENAYTFYGFDIFYGHLEYFLEIWDIL
jgi:hypothetical protein